MGISPFGHSYCSCDCNNNYSNSYQSTKLPNPDPSKFDILDIQQMGRYIILWVRYPDCTNYEGQKIMVYENLSLGQLKKQKRLDPHFCEGDHYSPIARFEPTNRGMEMAITFCRAMRKEEEG